MRVIATPLKNVRGDAARHAEDIVRIEQLRTRQHAETAEALA
jgi:hypothetical protein